MRFLASSASDHHPRCDDTYTPAKEEKLPLLHRKKNSSTHRKLGAAPGAEPLLERSSHPDQAFINLDEQQPLGGQPNHNASVPSTKQDLLIPIEGSAMTLPPQRSVSAYAGQQSPALLVNIESGNHGGSSDQDSGSNYEAGTGLRNDLFINFDDAINQLPSQQRELGHRLRRHLQFFFMDPLQKYRVRRQFPFKLVLQILKVVFVTVQLVLFAEMRISHVDFLDDTVTVMRHKFLMNWSSERDTVAYPPATGRYAVFSSREIVEHFAHIVQSYYSIQNESFASFSYDSAPIHRGYPIPSSAHSYSTRGKKSSSRPTGVEEHFDFNSIPPLHLCINRIADVNVQNETYIFDISEVNECFSLNFTQAELNQIKKEPQSIRQMMAKRNITFRPEDALILSHATVKFNLRTIHFSPLSTDQKPECYLIKVAIDFDNSRHTGQVSVHLTAIISYVNRCNGRVLQVGSVGVDALIIGIIDIVVLSMCVASLLLCCRALLKAHLLKSATEDFFGSVFKRRLSVRDRMDFINLWYVMILVNDLLIILGTVCKMSIEFRDFDSDLFTLTGMLLGLGALLVYLGLLRYLGFFNEYNVLVLTLKKSLPSILRFMVCTVILYLGFLIAGWVIIGPYSIKFRTLSQSSEALFSLLNGDDMFATFFTISDNSTAIKVFGTIYIYVFVCLFIYVVLSLFIAIIMDAYEVVKEQYNQGLEVERSTLQEFLASAEPPNLSSRDARDLFAADRLLRLDESWLLQNWSQLRRTLRNTCHRRRMMSGGGSGGRAGTHNLYDYQSFENPQGGAEATNDPTSTFALGAGPNGT